MSRLESSNKIWNWKNISNMVDLLFFLSFLVFAFFFVDFVYLVFILVAFDAVIVTFAFSFCFVLISDCTWFKSIPFISFLSLHIQSECGKMRTRITLNTDTFYAVNVSYSQNLLYMLVTSKPCSEAVARRCSLKKVLLKDFSRITEKRLCQSLFFNKVAGFRSQFWLNISII